MPENVISPANTSMPEGRKQAIVQATTIKHDQASRTFCKKFFSFSLPVADPSEVISFLLLRMINNILVYIVSNSVKPATFATPKYKLASRLCRKSKYTTRTQVSQSEPKDNNSFAFVTLNLCKIGYMILKYLSMLSTRSVQNEMEINR
jgi:hypothetical protein